ncbi:hypothetical protein RR48_09507 [Papilio machaon]|uniref:Uncharacterized protein n=1 Tax=Papilio machaon TaxID=76193 RepID=A0A194QXV6_PAPMA|nr:hypothetical protein RR48_09507 [Papilio machaon]
MRESELRIFYERNKIFEYFVAKAAGGRALVRRQTVLAQHQKQQQTVLGGGAANCLHHCLQLLLARVPAADVLYAFLQATHAYALRTLWRRDTSSPGSRRIASKAICSS